MGYDEHNHVHHCVEDHCKCPRKPSFSIQVLCHDPDLKNWLLYMDFKKEDSHGMTVGEHLQFQLSENLIEKVIAKIHEMPRKELYAVGDGK